MLEEYRIPVFGDQLTRVRLQGAKALRNLATSTKMRLETLEPVVIVQWHNKQDFIEVYTKATISSCACLITDLW